MRRLLAACLLLSACADAPRRAEVDDPARTHRRPMLRIRTPEDDVRDSIRIDSVRSHIPNTIAPDTTPIILFALRNPPGGLPQLDPIVVIRDSLEQPPIGADGDAPRERFIAQWYRRGTAYRAFARGREIGRAHALGAQPAGCVGLSADAVVTPLDVNDTIGIATNAQRSLALAAQLREATDGERRELAHLARNGLPDTVPAALRTPPMTRAVVVPGSPDLLVASFLRYASDGRGITMLIVAESGGGALRAAYQEFHIYTEEDKVVPEFVDVFDIDGENTAELILEHHYWESSRFSILARRAGRWRFIYSGGGGGC